MIPTKLRDDAIVEALCQLQFSTPELGELVVGRLSDIPGSGSYSASHLPLANVPAAMRRMDPALQGQPILQLSGSRGRKVQVGESVISSHAVGVSMYPGWETFRADLSVVFEPVFTKLRDVRIDRVTLRYVNALVPARHFVPSLNSLQLKVLVAGDEVQGDVNVNFLSRPSPAHVVTTRVASPSFVQGQLPSDAIAVVDVEIASSPEARLPDWQFVQKWIDEAHHLEKEAFFRLLPDRVVEQLKES